MIHKYQNLFNEICKKRKKELIIFFFLFIIGFSVYGFWEHSYIKQHGIYTVGTAENLEMGHQGALCTISFYYEGKMYKKHVGLGYLDYPNRKYQHNGERFFIQFLPQNPKRFVVLDFVPDCITEAPPEGWGKIPECR